jgi:hypothetical protein
MGDKPLKTGIGRNRTDLLAWMPSGEGDHDADWDIR